jgi:hypothetical protein
VNLEVRVGNSATSYYWGCNTRCSCFHNNDALATYNSEWGSMPMRCYGTSKLLY